MEPLQIPNPQNVISKSFSSPHHTHSAGLSYYRQKMWIAPGTYQTCFGITFVEAQSELMHGCNVIPKLSCFFSAALCLAAFCPLWNLFFFFFKSFAIYLHRLQLQCSIIHYSAELRSQHTITVIIWRELELFYSQPSHGHEMANWKPSCLHSLLEASRNFCWKTGNTTVVTGLKQKCNQWI